MEDFQQRVMTERAQLCVRIISLNSFMTTGIYQSVDPDEQNRLIKQVKIMKEYLDILDERIKCFNPYGEPSRPNTQLTADIKIALIKELQTI